MGKIKVDQIEVESASSVQINNPLKVDNISEKTSGSGVVISKPKSTIQTLTSSSNTLTINVENGTVGAVTLNENITDIDFTNVPTSGVATFTLQLTQDSTDRTVAINAVTVNGGSDVTAKTVGGAGFTMTTGSGSIDLITFLFVDAGTPLLNAQQNFS